MIGSDSVSARLKSSSKAFDSALSALAAAELLDPQVGMRALRGGGRRERRVDAVGDLLVVAGDLERHDRRAAVLRDLALVAASQRRLDVGDVARRLEAAGDVAHRGGEARVGGLQRAAALDEDLLGCIVGEVGVSRSPARRRRTGRWTVSASVSSRWPTAPPATVARTTKRIHPRIALLRCWALQRPMRAARLRCIVAAPSTGGSRALRTRLTAGRGVFDAGARCLGGADNPTRGRASAGDRRLRAGGPGRTSGSRISRPR